MATSRALGILLAALVLIAGPGSRETLAQENIDPRGDGSQYVYGENVGWLNLEPLGDGGPGVQVGGSALSGYIWSENAGWIALSCADSSACDRVSFGVVNDGAGRLSGFAWGENVGWINFAPTGGGVFIDQCGDFNGAAWGENIGWILFRSDGATPFRVATTWVPPDLFPPVTSASSPGSPWSNLDVTVTLTASDNPCGSGVKAIHYRLDGSAEVVADGNSASVLIDSEGLHMLEYFSVDAAGNAEVIRALAVGIDRTPPEVKLVAPADGARYLLHSAVLADHAAADPLSGLASVTATVPSGSPIDTSTAGVRAFSVSATDRAGNTASVTHTYEVVFPGNIDPDGGGSQYAYGENVGWINFKPSYGDGVTVTDTAVSGQAWGENIGWINLAPALGGVRNDGFGTLSGFAWGENVGWINFAPSGAGVFISPRSGEFSGRAWGENVGWISFASAGAVPFHLETSWRARPPAGTPFLTLSPSGDECLLEWTPLADATTYDVVRGDLGALHASRGDFTISTDACLADDLAAASLLITERPAPGAGSWYLARGVNPAGAGTYDSGSPSQVGLRDSEIDAASLSCP